MAFNVADFRAQISNSKFGGLALSNKFIVRITPPSKVFTGKGDSFPTMEQLTFFCSTANLPGKTINTVDYKPYAYGQVNKMPLSRSNDSLTTTFFGDSNYLIMGFFQRWLNYIVQDGGEVWDNRASREIAYKEDYVSYVEIIGYDQDSQEKVTYTLFEAFPTQIGAVQMGWEQNDTTIQIPIEFTYDDMIITRESVNASDFTKTRTPVGLFTRIAQAASIVGVINTINRPRNIQDLINQGTTIRTLGRGLGVF
tara:strand:- start:746 stop:1504 length:759 start_codon:yes stop_codon:yes gene_type:complete